MRFQDLSIALGADKGPNSQVVKLIVEAFLRHQIAIGQTEGLVGVHRVTRNNPFDEHRRRTSTFVLVGAENWDYQVASHTFSPYFLVKKLTTGKEYNTPQDAYGEYWVPDFLGYQPKVG